MSDDAKNTVKIKITSDFINYNKDCEIGSGTFGKVYKYNCAIYTDSHPKIVVVKKLTSNLTNIDHRNIITYYVDAH